MDFELLLLPIAEHRARALAPVQRALSAPAASSAWQVADWYAENKFYSPYYTESHVEFAAKVRAFVDAEIRPNVLKWYAPRSLLLTDPRR